VQRSRRRLATRTPPPKATNYAATNIDCEPFEISA
jgi:hypothetical protein